MPDVKGIIDRHYSVRLGVSLADVPPGQVAVTACARRTFAEPNNDSIRPLWIFRLGDRAAISVHPAASGEVARLAWRLSPEEVMEDGFCDQAAAVLRAALSELPPGCEECETTLYHPGGASPITTDAEIRPLVPADSRRWAGPHVNVWAPQHPSAERGEAFGVSVGDKVIAWVITQESASAETAHLIVSDGIETAEGYRRQGYGKALLAHWTCEMQANCRVCLHDTAADNAASAALAQSVGYVGYARSRFIIYQRPREDGAANRPA